MNANDLKLRLLAGMPIPIEGLGHVTPPTLREIIYIGESKYNALLSSLLVNKELIKHDFEGDITDFELAIALNYYNESFRSLFTEGLELFFQEKPFFLQENGLFYFGEIADERFLTKERFDMLQQIIKEANKISNVNEPEFNPANERAKKLVEMILKNRKSKPQKKEIINLHSTISGLAWKSNSINIQNVFDLTIYQLYDGISRLDNIDYFQNTMTGLYSGAIDKRSINLEQINWKKILD